MTTKDKDVEELNKRIERGSLHVKKLTEEIMIMDRTIQLLIIAGHLDKERLEQATQLAGGL